MAELVVRMGAADVGRHTLRVSRDRRGGEHPTGSPIWNRLGYGNNAIEVIYVDVR